MNSCKTKWQRKWLRLDVVDPVIQTLADDAEAFCVRWFNNNPDKSLLVIIGEFGSGKTHTAKAIFRFCNAASALAFETEKWGKNKMPDAAFISWPEAASSFNEKQFGIMDDANTSDLTIIDDVGAENDPWKICADKLCQILSRRERKFTIVTTNIRPESWSERFDGRINDRLLRNSVIIDISRVPSYSTRPSHATSFVNIALKVANRIISNQDSWSYDNCKVDVSKLKSKPLASVIEPYADKLTETQIVNAWIDAVFVAHGAQVDGLANNPTAYCVTVFKEKLKQ